MRIYLVIAILIMGSFCFSNCFFEKRKEDLRVKDIEIFKDTPAWELAKAVRRQNIKKIDKIVKKDSSLLNYKESKFDTTLLMWAIDSEKYKSVKELLELGADPNIISKKMGGTALFNALDRDDIKYAQLLLDYKADPNAAYCVPNDGNIIKSPYECGTSALMYSVSPLGSGIDKVKLLVEYGADINCKTKLENTATIQALLYDDIESAYYLIVEKKADIREAYHMDSTLTGIQNDQFYYPVDLLLDWVYPLDSKEYQMKIAIVEEFKRQGVDYNSRKANLPQRTLNQIQKLYPTNWEYYLEKY
jgi:ankyrin repeat protein